MNFFRYLGVSREEFEVYLQDGRVSESLHKEFPLNLFTYSRETVATNNWDKVTSKCRGIIVHRWTEEIVARPFEKFFNYGSPEAEEQFSWRVYAADNPPTIIEKMDGFLITGYRWEGRWYAASKGSFHSPYAKWATAELSKKTPYVEWPHNHTPVFEGLHPDLRIVVDYGKRQGLVLLALINNDTGEEVPFKQLTEEARIRGFEVPTVYNIDLPEAVSRTRKDGVMPGEGYVLTWYRDGAPPFRLKLKYLEYFRLHRTVTGTSPKHIFEMVSQPWLGGELKDYIDNTTPWFSSFVKKWVTALRGEFSRIQTEATTRYTRVKRMVEQHSHEYANLGQMRKAYALEFLKPENKEFAGVMFAMLDDKDSSAVIWKKVKEMTAHSHPLRDSYSI